MQIQSAPLGLFAAFSVSELEMSVRFCDATSPTYTFEQVVRSGQKFTFAVDQPFKISLAKKGNSE